VQYFTVACGVVRWAGAQYELHRRCNCDAVQARRQSRYHAYIGMHGVRFRSAIWIGAKIDSLFRWPARPAEYAGCLTIHHISSIICPNSQSITLTMSNRQMQKLCHQRCRGSEWRHMPYCLEHSSLCVVWYDFTMAFIRSCTI